MYGKISCYNQYTKPFAKKKNLEHGGIYRIAATATAVTATAVTATADTAAATIVVAAVTEAAARGCQGSSQSCRTSDMLGQVRHTLWAFQGRSYRAIGATLRFQEGYKLNLGDTNRTRRFTPRQIHL